MLRSEAESTFSSCVTTSSLAYQLCRYPALDEQQPSVKDVFYGDGHHFSSAAGPACSLSPYASSAHPASGYGSSSDAILNDPGLEVQTAAHMLDAGDGFGFGLNHSTGNGGGSGTGQTYSAAGQNGKRSDTGKAGTLTGLSPSIIFQFILFLDYNFI